MAKQHDQLSFTVASVWASTKPGQTRFHYFDGDGGTLCSYERKAGLLTPWGDAKRVPPDACSSCLLHFKKGHHLAAAQPGPATELSPETRVRVIKGELKGAIGRIQRYDPQSRLYFVAFTSRTTKEFKPLAPTDLEEAPL
ncbi:hypothetical protein CDA63_11875 [Hymenobacter amundsenii]|uniref:Uncharacterized protein n=1 Tax=Hymenobacter amundsenii TaxID=2006685 RepID=A0A246FK25_9BACT|nr:hypothetical protein [Hymenobacter amundsenii]OWP62910.1 hypothetical protein CDA63_11875 [Hymenobacter amundsenii]